MYKLTIVTDDIDDAVLAADMVEYIFGTRDLSFELVEMEQIGEAETVQMIRDVRNSLDDFRMYDVPMILSNTATGKSLYVGDNDNDIVDFIDSNRTMVNSGVFANFPVTGNFTGWVRDNISNPDLRDWQTYNANCPKNSYAVDTSMEVFNGSIIVDDNFTVAQGSSFNPEPFGATDGHDGVDPNHSHPYDDAEVTPLSAKAAVLDEKLAEHMVMSVIDDLTKLNEVTEDDLVNFAKAGFAGMVDAIKKDSKALMDRANERKLIKDAKSGNLEAIKALQKYRDQNSGNAGIQKRISNEISDLDGLEKKATADAKKAAKSTNMKSSAKAEKSDEMSDTAIQAFKNAGKSKEDLAKARSIWNQNKDKPDAQKYKEMLDKAAEKLKEK